ncbi:MAG: glycosyltransferase, partial [Candidatus Eisenbacteria bacterium]
VLNIGESRRIPSDEYLHVLGLWDFVVKVVGFVRRGYTVHTHINGDGNKGWYLALTAELVCRLWGRPLVLTFHAGPVQRYFPRERSGAFTPLLWLLLKLPRRIICNDHHVQRSLLTYGVPAEKIRPIPAFSRQYLQYQPAGLDPELERFVKSHAPLLVVYFFLRPEFFVESLIEALAALARRHPGLGAVMVGGGSDQPGVPERLAAAGIEAHVHCAGDLDHDRFMTLLARAHFYVRTPSKDGVCSSVLEALSLGVPVVASENGRRPESVITFPPDDGAALARTLEEAWARYEAVRAAVRRPAVRDTVAEEAALLLELGGRAQAVPAAVPGREQS